MGSEASKDEHVWEKCEECGEMIDETGMNHDPDCEALERCEYCDVVNDMNHTPECFWNGGSVYWSE